MGKRKEFLSPREAILEASVRLFGELGYTGTTMRDIAKEVGVLPGSLYAHIESKEALLLEIVGAGIDGFLSIMHQVEVASAKTADERLRIAIHAHLAAIAEDPGRTLVIFHQWRYLTGENRARAVMMRREYADAYKKIISDGVDAGIFRPDLNLRVTAFSILGALNWASEWYSASGPMTAEELGDEFTNTFLNGLYETPKNRKEKAPVKRVKIK